MPVSAKPGNIPAFSAARRRRLEALRPALDRLYSHYNDRRFVYPDPLAPIYQFGDPRDQEIVGLIASALAFGNVKQILKSIDLVIARFPRPAQTLPTLRDASIYQRLTDFRHRYVTGDELGALLGATAQALREHGSLGACFAEGDTPEAPTLLPGLNQFVQYLQSHSTLHKNYLLPDPSRGSACKRWFMFLRWMVRADTVDLGLWHNLGPARLIVPVDTHMHRVARGLGLTRRNSADLKTALEITRAFQILCPEDPVRYDFCLTRLGIRDDGDMAGFVKDATGRPVRR